eukprot:6374383-Amphidinium_carterae.1
MQMLFDSRRMTSSRTCRAQQEARLGGRRLRHGRAHGSRCPIRRISATWQNLGVPRLLVRR